MSFVHASMWCMLGENKNVVYDAINTCLFVVTASGKLYHGSTREVIGDCPYVSW